jgi:hypothetical protein
MAAAFGVVAIATLAVMAWMLLRSMLRGRGRRGAGLHVTAYCGRCNWEGETVLRAMRCRRCDSTSMTVVSTGVRSSR